MAREASEETKTKIFKALNVYSRYVAPLFATSKDTEEMGYVYLLLIIKLTL